MKCRNFGGFALPSVLITSVIMMTVLVASVSSVASIRSAVSTQYYNQLAKTASESGVAYAKSCIESNAGSVTWSDEKKLGPNTDCSGNQLVGFTCPENSLDERCSVYVGDNVLSSFSVGAPTVGSGGVVTKITANGIVNLLRSSDSVSWRTYIQTSQLAIENPTSLNATASVNLFVVGGGGGGGARHGGGGGGGGIVNKIHTLTTGSYSVVIGAGGAGGLASGSAAGANGGNSLFDGIVAYGGGGGGSNNGSTTGRDGGSGGGGNASASGGNADQPTFVDGGFGNIGGNGLYSTYYMGGGGGGAGGPGGTAVYPNAGSGGAGMQVRLAGTLTTYGTGGSGGVYNTNTVGANASSGTGRGGGGSGGETNNGGNGGSGVVIISYPIGSMVATGGITSTFNGRRIHRFTSNNTFTISSIGSWSYSRDINISNSNTYTMNDYQVLVSPFNDSNFINNTGLLGSWHFNEDGDYSVKLAYDSSGNGNHGSFTGTSLKTTEGRFGNAFVGNGSHTNKVVVPHDKSISPTNSLTIETWINFAESSTKEIITKMNDAGTAPASFELFQDGQKISFRLYKASTAYTLTSTTDLALNTWHHVVATWDGVTKKIYINGVLNTQSSLSAPIDATAGVISIGAHSNNAYLFNGKIDEVKIYNRALSGPATNCTANDQSEVCKRYGVFGVPKIRSDYGDVRFTDPTGSIQYSYWQEADNKFWVKVPSLVPGESKIKMYYGNVIASSVSNGDDTFAFFDDFSRKIIDNSKWVEIDVGSKMTQSNGSLRLTKSASAWDSAWISREIFSRTPGLVLGGAFKADSSVVAPNHVMIGWANNQYTAPSYTNSAHSIYYNYGNLANVYENGSSYSATGGTYLPYSYNLFNIRLRATGADYYNNATTMYTGAGGSLTTSPLRIGIHQHSHIGNIYFIYVRQGSTNEPTTSAPGTEINLANYVTL